MINSGDLPAMPLSGGSEPFHGYQGMTKREMMAMHILSGMLSSENFNPTREQAASFAVGQADALLAELERTK